MFFLFKKKILPLVLAFSSSHTEYAVKQTIPLPVNVSPSQCQSSATVTPFNPFQTTNPSNYFANILPPAPQVLRGLLEILPAVMGQDTGAQSQGGHAKPHTERHQGIKPTVILLCDDSSNRCTTVLPVYKLFNTQM